MTTTMGSLDLSALNNLYDETQYFWFESNSQPWGAGAHVTLYPESEFTTSTHANYLKGQNILMNTDGLSIRNGTLPMMILDNDSLDFNVVDTINQTYTNVASFGNDSARVGKVANDNSRTEISGSGMQVLYRDSGSDVQITNLGYDTGKNVSDGSSKAPYYTLGKRHGTPYNYTQTTYGIGELCTYDGTVYMCIQDITTPEAFTPSHWSTVFIGNYSCAEGFENASRGYCSHAEGYGTSAIGQGSHSEGNWTKAYKLSSHAEGAYSQAEGQNSHAEGYMTKATNWETHAEGSNTVASGTDSHAEGYESVAIGKYSHAQNRKTIAGYDYQTTIGKFNENKSDDLFEIGNGTASTPSNAFEVDVDGNVNASGAITVEYHASPIGTRKVTTGSYSVATGNDYVTVPTTGLTRLSLEAGSWIINLSAQYASNATGRRGCAIYNVTTSTRVSRSEVNQTAVSGAQTKLQTSIVVVLDATTTITAQLSQNSGGARTCDLVLEAMRIA